MYQKIILKIQIYIIKTKDLNINLYFVEKSNYKGCNDIDVINKYTFKHNSIIFD